MNTKRYFVWLLLSAILLLTAPGHLINNPEVKRFMKLWSAVLRNVPSPNADQKPQ